MQATTLDQVLTEMRALTEVAEREGSRIGYFAALYTRVTAAVTRGIRAGFFEDGPQMERLDVAFANLYLDGVRRYRAGEGGVRAAWRVAFEVAERPEATLLQHIYLGMNAHLLVDLPIAVATTCPREKLSSLRADFFRINLLVDGEMGAFHDDLCQVSPGLTRLRGRAGRLWEASSSLTLRASRRLAWSAAEWLAGREVESQARMLEVVDRAAARIGEQIGGGGGGLPVWRGLREGEREEVSEVVRVLRGGHG
jgi:Family of unknown function (DUF5995)